ncbi:MAG: hypothetical protein A3I89_00565 [Candidatus Harrisonbacteria bacterium RIFCSPLOWO2_02_FULL_41_11]|uniref:Phosphoglycerate mutase n=1 Tax=Candidatus Harrisonbacteria bacterium RIFCSPHIGHO2_02_FULL_42_16 TaxID=1798404 RepID=A0A1G1ZJE5_9BACT|nr:MAG: hypothetical protein A3B92_02370 [Candidatus Harrisonbacteria bacterium RIFCSPHIGHO2_02_FULL_42_16]OGY66489.1 MAG: hypothetical protein A3I89_00565 [Candidatus Harrisonbacteria bacterium RIFCSPLOWO2_02_FULL_41_11]
MKLFFIRHAESIAHTKKLFPSYFEELSAGGKKEVGDMANKLRSNNFDTIISSPMKRTLETAKIIGETLKISIITNKLLEDRDYGSFSGKPLEQFKKQGDAQANNSLGFNYSKWEGESGDDVRGRVIKFIEKIKIEYPQKNILIVTHADIIRMMYVLFLKLEYRKVFPIKNVSVHEFEI